MKSEASSARRSGIKHVILLVGGTGTSQVLLGLTAPLLTRIYSPRDFGIYAVALAIYNILAAVACLRYELAIVLPRSNRAAANVAALCLVVTTGVASIAIVLSVFAYAADAAGLHVGLLWWEVVLVPIGVLLFGLQQAVRMWCVRHHEFSTITNMVMTQTVVMIGFQLGAGALLSSDPVWLMLGTVLGLAAMIVVAVPYLKRTVPSTLFAAVRLSRIIALAKRHRRFPLYSSSVGFISQAAGRVLLLILAAFVTTATIGEFALAQRVIYLPVTVIAGSMSSVFYSRAAQQLHNPKLHQLVFRVLIAGGLVFVPLVALNFIVAEPFFAFAFGVRWAEAGRFAAYLGIASGFITLVSWLDRIYDICSRQRLLLVLEIFGDTGSLFILAVIMYLTRDAVLGIAGYSVGMVSYYVVWTFVSYRVAAFPLLQYGIVMVTIAVATAFAIISEMVIASLIPGMALRAVLFVVINAPLLFVGVRIGHNGLRQRETQIATLRI